MQLTGALDKMDTALIDGIAHYDLVVGNSSLPLNEHIGNTITLQYQHQIVCTNCGRITKKSYSQGYCYPCAQRLACCDLCIVNPHTCHYHLGTCREPEWGEQFCFTPHVVYLANSSNVKVGITRSENIPHRWMDQGAMFALPMLSVTSRYHSGIIEHQLRQFISDKTNWRKMLTSDSQPQDLVAQKNNLLKQIPEQIKELDASILADNLLTIRYPIEQYPHKVVSLNFDKMPAIHGTLLGIKGQYLILDIGVLNIRKFSAYIVTVEVD